MSLKTSSRRRRPLMINKLVVSLNVYGRCTVYSRDTSERSSGRSVRRITKAFDIRSVWQSLNGVIGFNSVNRERLVRTQRFNFIFEIFIFGWKAESTMILSKFFAKEFCCVCINYFKDYCKDYSQKMMITSKVIFLLLPRRNVNTLRGSEMNKFSVLQTLYRNITIFFR